MGRLFARQPLVLIVLASCAFQVANWCYADEKPAKHLLLLAQGPDGHPPGTHEYVAGQQILQQCLRDVPGLKTTIVRADGDWPEGPELLAKADGAVLFVSEGAKWLNSDPARRQAFAELAKRGGGIFALHWGMGTKAAENIDPFVRLLGACHGGDDRKIKFLETDVKVVAKGHPVTAGIDDFRINDEFYYRLKILPEAKLQPLLTATIDGEDHMVAWAWQRPDGGRSLGYSGCHFHANWSRPEYQRFLSQAALWIVNVEAPREGFPAKVGEKVLELGDR